MRSTDPEVEGAGRGSPPRGSSRAGSSDPIDDRVVAVAHVDDGGAAVEVDDGGAAVEVDVVADAISSGRRG
ncbi:MAG: hypothetical protein H6709_05805 [Kofleriaceae bacterium]|nr:hypothetical protein [Kofleriaceae bacterium]MCB9571587.1 hypothetical protein [Kofleriaceae bacterium]